MVRWYLGCRIWDFPPATAKRGPAINPKSGIPNTKSFYQLFRRYSDVGYGDIGSPYVSLGRKPDFST